MSAAPDTSAAVDPAPVNIVEASNSQKQPPPESSQSISMRRWILVSFWAVALFLGLPMWWKTTTVYRAPLPLDQMLEWADGKVPAELGNTCRLDLTNNLQVCRPTFPLRIAVEAPALPVQEAQHLIRTTQHALDDLNDFSAHHLRLLLSGRAQNSSDRITSSVPVIKTAGESDGLQGEDIALSIKLLPGESGSTPRADLHPYKPTLDVYYSPNQIPSSSSTASPLASFIANELQAIFNEEQATLAHLLASIPSQAPQTKRISPELTDLLARRMTRSFKYSPTYHLTFSLFTPTDVPSNWDIEGALDAYLSPLLESLSSISNFTVDSQVQIYATFSPSIPGPEYDEQKSAWTLRKADLSGFVNAAEWPLSPSIGVGPTINFILYVPAGNQSPLVIQENGGNSWLVPQWGGVQILNPQGSKAGSKLSKEDLRPAMQTFSNQLLSLLGLPQSPQSLPLRMSTLTRVHAASLIFSASSTLGALARLTKTLRSIAIPDTVARDVQQTISHLQQACNDLRDGRFHNALESARTAEAEAERAFFERSMVGQVYFPDEHKIAVYMPLLGPVAVPLVMSAIKEIKSMRKKRV
jgi:phosphatidylinositol glycan class S